MSAQAPTPPATRQWARVATVALLVLSLPLFLAPPTPDDDGDTILGVRIPDLPGLDKSVHALVFALLGAAGTLGWPGRRPTRRLLALLLAYGALTELAQWFIPGRAASILDWLADAAGALVGVWVGASRRRPES